MVFNAPQCNTIELNKLVKQWSNFVSDFENSGRCHLISKTGAPVDPQKRNNILTNIWEKTWCSVYVEFR